MSFVVLSGRPLRLRTSVIYDVRGDGLADTEVSILAETRSTPWHGAAYVDLLVEGNRF